LSDAHPLYLTLNTSPRLTTNLGFTSTPAPTVDTGVGSALYLKANIIGSGALSAFVLITHLLTPAGTSISASLRR
jgi:hypothetical protein